MMDWETVLYAAGQCFLIVNIVIWLVWLSLPDVKPRLRWAAAISVALLIYTLIVVTVEQVIGAAA